MYPFYRQVMSYSNWRHTLKNEIVISANGEVLAPPDTVIIKLGVVSRNQNIEKAQQENAFKMRQIILALKNQFVQENEIKTAVYFVRPIYENAQNEDSTIIAYEVTNIIEITTNRLYKTGEIIDTAVQNGANRVDDIVYQLKTSEPYRKKAYELAIQESIQKAQMIANGYGANVSFPPYKIIEQERAVLALSQGVAPTTEKVFFPRDITVSVHLTVHFMFDKI